MFEVVINIGKKYKSEKFHKIQEKKIKLAKNSTLKKGWLTMQRIMKQPLRIS